MTNRTAWTAGNGVGYVWTAAFGAEISTLAGGNSVLSSVSVTNQSAQDIWMDLSVIGTIAATTLTAGAGLSFWVYPLLHDGATYGDGNFGSAQTYTPGPPADGVFNFSIPAANQTAIDAYVKGIIIPPGTFKLVMRNGLLPSTAFATMAVQYRTYNMALNN